jgi:hypothetical protein
VTSMATIAAPSASLQLLEQLESPATVWPMRNEKREWVQVFEEEVGWVLVSLDSDQMPARLAAKGYTLAPREFDMALDLAKGEECDCLGVSRWPDGDMDFFWVK